MGLNSKTFWKFMRQVTMEISCCGTTNSMWSQSLILLYMNVKFFWKSVCCKLQCYFWLGLKLAALCSGDQSKIEVWIRFGRCPGSILVLMASSLLSVSFNSSFFSLAWVVCGEESVMSMWGSIIFYKESRSQLMVSSRTVETKA